MNAMLRRVGMLEKRAGNLWRQPELRHRISFVEPDSSRSGGRVVSFFLVGNGWSDAERAAAIEENRALALHSRRNDCCNASRRLTGPAV